MTFRNCSVESYYVIKGDGATHLSADMDSVLTLSVHLSCNLHISPHSQLPTCKTERIEFPYTFPYFYSCCCLVIKLCPTLRDPMDQSMPGPPVFHCLPELGLIHVGRFDVTVQPLSSVVPFLPSHFPNIRGFSRKSSLLMRWTPSQIAAL